MPAYESSIKIKVDDAPSGRDWFIELFPLGKWTQNVFGMNNKGVFGLKGDDKLEFEQECWIEYRNSEIFLCFGVDRDGTHVRAKVSSDILNGDLVESWFSTYGYGAGGKVYYHAPEDN